MSRRLPAILPLTLAATVGLFALTTALTAQPPKAAPPAAAPAADAGVDALKKQEELNARLFKDFMQAMLRLAQRLEKSDKAEDQGRAKTIRAAIELAERDGVDGQFAKLIAKMAQSRNPNAADLGVISGQDKQLTQALREILAVLMTDDESARLKEEIERLKAYLEEAKRIQREQEVHRSRTESNKGDKDRLAKDQDALAKRTQELANKMAGKKGDGKSGDQQAKGGPEKDDRAEPKPEGKPGDAQGEAKTDTQESKSSSKDGEGKDGAGQPKDGKSGSESKPGAPMGKMPDGGSAREGKEGEPKAGEPKPMGDPKSGDPKSGEPKAGDPKGGEPKPAPPGDNKSQSQGKGEGKPSGEKAGEGKPMGGEGQQGSPKPSPPSQGSQGSPPQGSPPPGGPQPPKPETPGQRKIEQAVPDQYDAKKNIEENKRADASKKEDDAIKKIQDAIKELEKRLKQLREEEMLKLLAKLEDRCNKMLQMQVEVYEATKSIHAAVIKNGDQKTPAEVQKSQVQSDKEGEIVAEADKALKLLEGEGSAVAFAGVLQEVRTDMAAVQKRLFNTYVGTDTQQIEEDIIAQLKEMIAALKKAQQDMQNKPSDPKDPSNNKPNQKLIDMLAELKLIRSLQVQVNNRTVTHSKRFAGEQANDPIIRDEIRQLSERQAKIQDMLHKIAVGANQ